MIPFGRKSMVTFIEGIGTKALVVARSVINTLFFAWQAIVHLADRKTYNNATKMVIVTQLYFTAVQILPLFISISVILGLFLMGIVFESIKNLGMTGYLGNILMGFIVTELCPFMTVLMLALRSGAAINTEIAVMKVNKEFDALSVFNIDIFDYIYVPRILNGVVSVVLLNGVFTLVLLTSGAIFSRVIFGIGMDAYISILITSAEFPDLVILLLKCATFGFFITLLPIRYGLTASNELTSIPIAVLNGMINVFIAIVIIEVISLILSSI
ncbi:MAG: putative phospholipid ABC transporter permease protein MlaE [Syntrophus sp. PtaB.Bin075]|nr:MAG: putative phospholipid ABC transporter permease protein MlaE [Syntrophus sp. PtaB.Bin075]